MPELEQFLTEKTYKNQGLDVGTRVFYTLIGEPEDLKREQLQAHRNSKALALIMKMLREFGVLTDERIDKMLLEVVS